MRTGKLSTFTGYAVMAGALALGAVLVARPPVKTYGMPSFFNSAVVFSDDGATWVSMEEVPQGAKTNRIGIRELEQKPGTMFVLTRGQMFFGTVFVSAFLFFFGLLWLIDLKFGISPTGMRRRNALKEAARRAAPVPQLQ